MVLGSLGWWPSQIHADGRGGPGGWSGQWGDVFARQCLGEPVGVALGQHEMGVVQLFNIAAVTRYRWRGLNISTPWAA
jgi:hypothetical protein